MSRIGNHQTALQTVIAGILLYHRDQIDQAEVAQVHGQQAVEGVVALDDQAFERPDARGEIDDAVADGRAAASEPARHEPSVADHPLVARPGAQSELVQKQFFKRAPFAASRSMLGVRIVGCP